MDPISKILTAGRIIAKELKANPFLKEAMKGYRPETGNQAHDKITAINTIVEMLNSSSFFRYLWLEKSIKALEMLIQTPSPFKKLAPAHAELLRKLSTIKIAIASEQTEQPIALLQSLAESIKIYAKKEQEEAFKVITKTTEGWDMEKMVILLRQVAKAPTT